MKLSDPLRTLLFSANEYISLYVARSLSGGRYATYFLGPSGQTIRFSRFCKKYFTCKNTDEALIEQINTLSKQYGFASVIPLDLSATVCIARIRSNLNCSVFPLSSAHDILRLANKWSIVPLLKTMDIRHPKTLLIKNPVELSDTVLSKPFLIKPLMQGGGKGIQKITCISDIEHYVKSFSPYKIFPLIVQEYIKGSDIDMSIVAKDGIIQGFTIQQWREGGDLEFIHNSEVFSIGQKIVRHLRFSGFMHIDMRREERSGKLFVLECNPRIWGTVGASIRAGVDFIGLALGQSQNIQILRFGHTGVTYIAPVRLLLMMLKNPLFFHHASYASKHDFFSMFTDPLPYIMLFVKLSMERIALRLPYTESIRKWLIDMERKTFFLPITGEHSNSGGTGLRISV